MTPLLEPVAFNIAANAIFAFGSAAAFTALIAAIFGRQNVTLRLYLLSLPFVKLALSFGAGIPSESYIFSSLNFFALPSGMGRYLMAGVDGGPFGPGLSLRLGIAPIGRSHDAVIPISAGDVLHTWLMQKVGTPLLTIFIVSLSAISTMNLIALISGWTRFEILRRRRRRMGTTLTTMRHGRRRIDFYIDGTDSRAPLTPYTGGFFRPYIAIPKALAQHFTPDECDAALAHEIAHVDSFDVPAALAVRILAAFFWFVPGLRRLDAALHRSRELRADRAAASTAPMRAALVGALLKVAEQLVSSNQRRLLPALALGADAAFLQKRCSELLTTDEQRPGHNWLRRGGAVVVALWTTAFVLTLTFGTNYRLSADDSWSTQVARRIEEWLRVR